MEKNLIFFSVGIYKHRKITSYQGYAPAYLLYLFCVKINILFNCVLFNQLNSLEPQYNTVQIKHGRSLDPDFTFHFSFLWNVSMFSKCVNKVIKIVDLESIRHNVTSPFNHQYFVTDKQLKTNHPPFGTSIHVYLRCTCEIQLKSLRCSQPD